VNGERGGRKRLLSLHSFVPAFTIIFSTLNSWRRGRCSTKPMSNNKEDRMKRMSLVICLVCLVSSVALAQRKTNVQWKCDKPSDQHSIPVGDKPGDAYAIEQVNCTAVKGDIAGNKIKSGVGTEFLYLKGADVTGHGEFIESMENGDKNLYKYEFSGTMKDGAFQSGTNKWSLMEGGGKMKGGKANGTCKSKANPDQSNSLDCMGTYTPAS